MRDQECQRGWRNAINAACMPDRARPMRLQFLFHFVRQAWERRIIKIIRQRETFIAPVSRDVGRLTRKIDIVLRIDFDLLGDLRSKLTKAWPDLREIGDGHGRI